VEGLLAGAAALANLPQDRLTPAIQSARSELWKQYHIGGTPSQRRAEGLTATGLKTGSASKIFTIRFGDAKPLPADQITPPVAPSKESVAIPATILPKQYVLYYRDENGRYIETATVGLLKPDLRFSEAILLRVDIPEAGKTKIIADGLFRYSDRKPMWQAQWEDILNLREKMVPQKRQSMEMEVRLGGKVIGTLTSGRLEEKEVKLELAAASAGLKPRTTVEEVVTRLMGEIDLPAGHQEILLIHRHIVDGQLSAIGVGMEPVIPAPEEKKKP
jgi:hypothetical protein